MLTIRLHRTGRKNQPFFKIVVTEKKLSSTRGRFVEELGHYNPLTKERKLNTERTKYWMSKGAQPTPTIHNMLVDEKAVEGAKIPKHKRSKKQQPAAETTPAAATPAAPAQAETAAPKPEQPTEKEEQKAEEPTPQEPEKPAEEAQPGPEPQEEPKET